MPESLPPDYETNDEFLKAAHHAMLEVWDFFSNLWKYKSCTQRRDLGTNVKSSGFDVCISAWNEVF